MYSDAQVLGILIATLAGTAGVSAALAGLVVYRVMKKGVVASPPTHTNGNGAKLTTNLIHYLFWMWVFSSALAVAVETVNAVMVLAIPSTAIWMMSSGAFSAYLGLMDPEAIKQRLLYGISKNTEKDRKDSGSGGS